ncbi:MAG: streptogramin lyase [Bradymonadia bacterium]|jgi:streptogramin lyase
MRRTPLYTLLAPLGFALTFAAGCGADSTRQIECEASVSEPCYCNDGREGVALCDAGFLGLCLCGDDIPADTDFEVPEPADVGQDGERFDAGEDTGADTPEEDAGCTELLLFPDGDGDGHGQNDAEPIRSCEYLAGYVVSATDCDDGDRSVFPTAPELCDERDNDCDTLVDEQTTPVSQWPDTDDDGYGDADAEPQTDCAAIPGYATNADDCDDEEATINPASADLCDGVDSDCDDEVDEAATFLVAYPDADADEYGDEDAAPVSFCEIPLGFVVNRDDCDDSTDQISPLGTEICNFEDDDCDGVFDEGVPLLLLWPDADGDDYGDAFSASVYSCDPIEGFVDSNTDCDDVLHTVNPLASERCNGRDDDCNGLLDDGAGDTRAYYPDADGDGYGVSTGPVQACELPLNFATESGDCDDRFSDDNPLAAEVCDGRDNDCNGEVDDGVTNACGVCGSVPVETCGNFIDDDCDGSIDEAGDGCYCDGRTNQTCYGAPPETLGVGICRGGTIDCACPGGARFCTDGTWGACEGQILPATELCDGIDNDCDGRADEGLRNSCGECAAEPIELCDGVDNDCDGAVDEFVRLPCGLCPGEEAGAEVCGNLFDDNCDGLVDEGCDCDEADEPCYPGPPDTLGVGACTAGTYECYATAESPSACTETVLPTIELCDGVDNDCDGTVDESSSGCSICGAATEICDDVDNDCDGFVDESLINGCGDCIADVTPEELGPAFLCNGLDEDCDGFTDEGLINACGNCDEFCYTDGWTSDGDFDDAGSGDGISPEDGLRLDTSNFTFADLWVANSADDTVTRINTNSGEVIGTYPVGLNPGSGNDSPSRTAVDLDGNAWIANRAFGSQGSVTKIRGGDCVTGCVLFTVPVGGSNGVPRALAIDVDNNVWVGNFIEQRIYKLNGDTGAVIGSWNIGMPTYGFAIDGEGIIWIASVSQSFGVGAFDSNTNTYLGNWSVPGCGVPYGIAVDASGNVWFGTWTCGTLGRLDRASFDSGARPPTITTHGSGLSNTRGVAVDATGTIWLASSGNNRVARFRGSDRAQLGTSGTCSNPIGVGVASDGNIWSMCNGSDSAQRWAPDGGLIQNVGVGDAPYSYSDMTGFALRAFTAPAGTWTQEMDCGFEGCGFEAVRWDAIVPAGTGLTVRARSRTGSGPWSAWTAAYSSSPASTSGAVPNGRYIQVELTMTTTEDELTPVVTNLSVDWQRP